MAEARIKLTIEDNTEEIFNNFKSLTDKLNPLLTSLQVSFIDRPQTLIDNLSKSFDSLIERSNQLYFRTDPNQYDNIDEKKKKGKKKSKDNTLNAGSVNPSLEAPFGYATGEVHHLDGTVIHLIPKVNLSSVLPPINSANPFLAGTQAYYDMEAQLQEISDFMKTGKTYKIYKPSKPKKGDDNSSKKNIPINDGEPAVGHSLESQKEFVQIQKNKIDPEYIYQELMKSWKTYSDAANQGDAFKKETREYALRATSIGKIFSVLTKKQAIELIKQIQKETGKSGQDLMDEIVRQGAATRDSISDKLATGIVTALFVPVEVIIRKAASKVPIFGPKLQAGIDSLIEMVPHDVLPIDKDIVRSANKITDELMDIRAQVKTLKTIVENPKRTFQDVKKAIKALKKLAKRAEDLVEEADKVFSKLDHSDEAGAEKNNNDPTLRNSTSAESSESKDVTDADRKTQSHKVQKGKTGTDVKLKDNAITRNFTGAQPEVSPEEKEQPNVLEEVVIQILEPYESLEKNKSKYNRTNAFEHQKIESDGDTQPKLDGRSPENNQQDSDSRDSNVTGAPKQSDNFEQGLDSKKESLFQKEAQLLDQLVNKFFSLEQAINTKDYFKLALDAGGNVASPYLSSKLSKGLERGLESDYLSEGFKNPLKGSEPVLDETEGRGIGAVVNGASERHRSGSSEQLSEPDADIIQERKDYTAAGWKLAAEKEEKTILPIAPRESIIANVVPSQLFYLVNQTSNLTDSGVAAMPSTSLPLIPDKSEEPVAGPQELLSPAPTQGPKTNSQNFFQKEAQLLDQRVNKFFSSEQTINTLVSGSGEQRGKMLENFATKELLGIDLSGKNKLEAIKRWLLQQLISLAASKWAEAGVVASTEAAKTGAAQTGFLARAAIFAGDIGKSLASAAASAFNAAVSVVEWISKIIPFPFSLAVIPAGIASIYGLYQGAKKLFKFKDGGITQNAQMFSFGAGGEHTGVFGENPSSKGEAFIPLEKLPDVVGRMVVTPQGKLDMEPLVQQVSALTSTVAQLKEHTSAPVVVMDQYNNILSQSQAKQVADSRVLG